MKRRFASVLLGLFCSISTASTLQKSVDKLIAEVDPQINISMSVIDLNTGETLYQRNAKRALIPASNMKLFSEAAALLILGPDYRFKTQLSTNAHLLEKGVLHGNLYLHLPGDPSFTQKHLSRLLSELSAWGIRTIQGHFIVVSDNRYINAYAPGWMVEDLKYSYGAPLSPLILDENRLTVTVNPAYQAGQQAFVEVLPSNAPVSLSNQVKTKTKSNGCGVDFNMTQDNRITVRGCIGASQWALQQGMAIRNPLQYAQGIIQRRLEALNITLHGNIQLGAMPQQTLLLATHSSKPIAQLLADTLKASDNLYADSLFLHAAAKLNGAPLNWTKAQSILKAFLQNQTGISLERAVLTDGSGLSRYNQLTAAQTTELLRFLHDNFPLSYEYIAALPIGGQDGTLQKRFRKPSEQGFIRAKTGTMRGVVSLSGYLYTANAHTLAFAIYINNLPGTSPSVSGKYRYLTDALCRFFLTQKPKFHLFVPPKNPHARLSYQQHPQQSDLQRAQKSKWRALESAIKQALKHQKVNILFRSHELELQDYNQHTQAVWNTLSSLRHKYPFVTILESSTPPPSSRNNALLLWIKVPRQPHNTPTRVWKIRAGQLKA